jgi:class 3 adenylate cyclase
MRRRTEGWLVDAQTKYAKTADGLHIAYQAVGAGPLDLVVVPNWITHVEGQWEIPAIARAFERFASFSRLIVYDQRGTGMSDPVPLDALPTLEQRMDDISAVMGAVGSEHAALFAWESAGPLAMLFAATYPDRTSALVLANVYACVLRDDDFPIGAPPELIESWLTQVPDSWGRAVPVPGLSHDQDERTIAMWARYQRQAASPGTAQALIRMLTTHDVRRVMGDIHVPTLVLAHQPPVETFQPYVANSRYLAERIPDAKLVEIGGEAPADMNVFVDEVQEFLTGVRQAPEADRVLATVLFSDIVGSTERAAKVGDREWRELLDQHDELVRRQLERFRGAEVKTLGDGFMATFDGPARAIRCAAAIREAVQRLDIRVRVGIHTGEVELRGDDVGGIAVHIAARVAALAGPSEVLVSRTVTDLVAGSGIAFADRGAHELKGVPGSWELYAVA